MASSLTVSLDRVMTLTQKRFLLSSPMVVLGIGEAVSGQIVPMAFLLVLALIAFLVPKELLTKNREIKIFKEWVYWSISVVLGILALVVFITLREL